MADLLDDIDVEDRDAQSEAELAISEQIAMLSQATDSPSEFRQSQPFEVEDVDLRTGAWMACLAAVQGWLRLPQDLDTSSVDAFVMSLAEALDFTDATDVVNYVGEAPRLTEAGLDRLTVRLQRALQLQEAFIADLEADGGTQASATGRWIEAWEEDEAISLDESAGVVSAKASTWSINEFSDRATRDRLNLSPSYQRGDVWPTSDAQMLIESILRGIPLPSVIILKQDGTAPYEVVDGKQRLTSILRFIGKHPAALRRVKEAEDVHPQSELAHLFETDYPRFRRAWKNYTGEQLSATREREYYFPFKLRTGSTALSGALGSLQGKYYSQITGTQIRIADEIVEVKTLFENQTDYKIPLIEYSRATRRQIHEVFNLYNKQGKHLNAEEIRNAVYHDVALMRGIIVSAGDITDVSGVAPFLVDVWGGRLGNLGETLEEYGFGTARYRRTKVLSWLASILFVDSMGPSGPRRLSTARHTDALLQRIQDGADDPLRTPTAARDALLLLSDAINAHAAVDEAWAPQFRDTGTGLKWQELQLVASLVGVGMAAATLGDQTMQRLIDVADDLSRLTASRLWQRPKKTQTATQWTYVARISLGVLDALGVEADAAAAALAERFGYSCVAGLQAIARDGSGD